MLAIMSKEIEGLTAKNAVTRASEDTGAFMNSLIPVPADGSWLPVVNTKPLNRFVVLPHFKMESVRPVKNLMQPGDWLIKLDLKDAYLTVPFINATGAISSFSGREWYGSSRCCPLA